jgi:hypothetical protein
MLSAFRAVWPPWWWALLAGAALLVVVYYAICPPSPPEAHLTSAGDLVTPYLRGLDAERRGLYGWAQLADLFFLALLAGWLVIGISRAIRRVGVPKAGWLVGVPLAAAVSDGCEDFALLIQAAGYPAEPLPSGLVTVLTTTKFVLYGLSLVVLITMGSLAVRRAMREQR